MVDIRWRFAFWTIPARCNAHGKRRTTEAKRGSLPQQIAEDDSAHRRIARIFNYDSVDRMITAKARSRRSPQKSKRATTVRVTVLHEDLFTAVRAKSLADCVTAHALAAVRIKFDFWDFNFLRDPTLRSKAARLCRQSGIVIVSAHSPYALPWDLECCIGDWLQFQTRTSRAFAILFANTEGYSSRTRALVSYWSTAAKVLGLDFFCEASVPDIRSGASDHSRVLTQQSPVKAPGLIAMASKKIRSTVQTGTGKMQYASGEPNSPAHCKAINLNASKNNPIFAGDEGLS